MDLLKQEDLARSEDRDTLLRRLQEEQALDEDSEMTQERDRKSIEYSKKGLDIEIYTPYQTAMESSLDDTFETFGFLEQIMLGFLAVSVRHLARKKKDYAPMIRSFAIRQKLKAHGKDYGFVTPLAQRPGNKHALTALEKLKVVKCTEIINHIKHYRVADLPVHLKSQLIYPPFDSGFPSLLPYLKKHRIHLMYNEEFNFVLPRSIIDADSVLASELEKIPSVTDNNNRVVYTVGNAFKLTFV